MEFGRVSFRHRWHLAAAVMGWVGLLPCVGYAGVINAVDEVWVWNPARFEAAEAARGR